MFWGVCGSFGWCRWVRGVAGLIWGLGDVFGALHTSLLLKSIFVSLLGLHVLSVDGYGVALVAEPEAPRR